MSVNLQIAAESTSIPDGKSFEQWVSLVLQVQAIQEDREVCVRLVDTEESAALNSRYRQKVGATNVLSFPSELPPGLPAEENRELGDLVICAPLVEKEAADQNKETFAHWAHLVVHGTLHLLGYDHLVDDEAEAMEALEIEILAQLNIPNPYLEKAITP